jgi:L-fucose dehydrogenase
MDLGLKDRVVLISGGARGIGASITQACLDEGARVVILSRVVDGVNEFVESMRAANRPCELLVAELESVDACRGAIDHIRERYGRLDALVNNAGVNDGVGLENGDPARFLKSLERNLLHYYNLAHLALPLLKAQPGSSIVNIGSKVAVTGQGNTSGYAAAKGAVLGLTREWAVELLPMGIRVNAVIPAEVMTPNYREWLMTHVNPEVSQARIEAQIPLGRRMTHPEEIAATVTFLLSPTQSGHTTGQILHVDGGYVHLDRAATAAPLH